MEPMEEMLKMKFFFTSIQLKLHGMKSPECNIDFKTNLLINIILKVNRVDALTFMPFFVKNISIALQVARLSD